MNRKNLPLLLMLTAGAVTCIITFIRQSSVLSKLVSLFCVMLIFYVLGNVFRWMLDFFDAQNEERRKMEEEAVEEEAEDQEGAQEPDQEHEQEQNQEPDSQ